MVSFTSIALLAIASIASAAPAPAPTTVTTGNWETYPPVPRTATYNGFADRIYDDIPECARDCVASDTSMTPCPYWDTGCLCVMTSFGDVVANCVAQACAGDQVATVTSLASSACSVAGVPSPYWFVGAAAADALETAAA